MNNLVAILKKRVKNKCSRIDYCRLFAASKDVKQFIKSRPKLACSLGIPPASFVSHIFESIIFFMEFHYNKKLFANCKDEFCFITDNEGIISFFIPRTFFANELQCSSRKISREIECLVKSEVIEVYSKNNGSKSRYALTDNALKRIVEFSVKEGLEMEDKMARRPDRNKTAGMEKAGVEVEVEKKVLVKTPTQKAIDFLLKIKNKIKQSEPDVLFNAHKDIGSKSVVRKFIEDLSPTDEELELCAEYYVNGWFGGASVKTRLVGVYFKVDSGGAGNTMENAKAWDKAGRPKERPSKFKSTNQNIGRGKQLSDEEKAEMEAALFGGK